MSTNTETTPTAAPSGPITLDQFAAELVAEQSAAADETEEEEKPEAVEAAPAEAEAVEEEAEDATLEADADDEEGEQEEEEAPVEVVPPPVSWSKEDAEVWAKLTPDAQKVVLKREADRDRAVAQTVQKASEISKQVQALAEETRRYAHLGEDAFEARWKEKAQGPIDWATALRDARDEVEFQQIMRNKAVYDAEKAEVENAQKAAAEQEALAHGAFVAEENQKLLQVAPELAGDTPAAKARREQVGRFLVERGIEPSVLKYASAAELSIASLALDGLKYREAEARAKTAATAPRKNPSAPPPKAIKASGSGDASPQRNLQALSHKLTNSGKLDDFVNLMVAESEQKARKKAARP